MTNNEKGHCAAATLKSPKVKVHSSIVKLSNCQTFKSWINIFPWWSKTHAEKKTHWELQSDNISFLLL